MRPVWIIDDDKSIRWVIEKSLAREGIVFRSFSAAQDALDALEDSAPQAVISDIRMPGASGLEFMQQLKSKLPSTPVIIMTAYSDLESAVAGVTDIETGGFNVIVVVADFAVSATLVAVIVTVV